MLLKAKPQIANGTASNLKHPKKRSPRAVAALQCPGAEAQSLNRPRRG
jgi:hypothetical protein